MGMLKMIAPDSSMVPATTETKGEVQTVFPQGLTIGYQMIEGVVMVDPTAAHNHRPLAEIVEKKEVMIDDDQGPGVVPEQFLEDFFLAWIEIGGGFVEDEEFRVHRHDGSKGRPFFLPVAEEMGRFVAQVGETDGGQPLLDPCRHRIFIEPLVHRPEGHILIQGVAE
ncbi:MAG: hypothetical protein ACD_75C00544G0001 [uncultured bacterium]|nr:MAG: hypothetical protein ACD_75C00544G0001 [uncultured bacterium]